MSHEIPRHWRLKQQRYNLVGEKCDSGHFVFPPRDVCPDCGRDAKDLYQFNGKGVVESYTTIQPESAPEGFENQAPYVVALVRLEEGPLVTAQLTDLEITRKKHIAYVDQAAGWPPIAVEAESTEFVVEIGMPVKMVTRKLKEDGDRGLITYGYKFRPMLDSR
jgi:uncharacterized protein